MTPAASDAITFRAARPDDALCLGVLSTQVFLDTYATQGIRRAVADEVLALHSVAAYEALLADAGVTILVAECAGHLIGSSRRSGTARATRRCPRPRRPNCGACTCRSTSPAAAFGRDLLRQAEKAAAARGAEMLWLTAWEGNKRALQFYPRCGYEDLGATV